MNDFSAIAPTYRESSSAQRAASGLVFDLLAIGPRDDVLDLGCGTGHLTQKIAAMTSGAVAGTDPSPGMIAEARREAPAIPFRVEAAEALDEPASYDVIFCNSAFHWFVDPARVLANCLAALRPGGRMAIQAPARRDYCPEFIAAVEALRRDARTRDVSAGFTSPWLFLESADEYAQLFREAGFRVASATIETLTERCTPAKAMGVFETGAAAGYLNPASYEGGADEAYLAAARSVIAGGLRAQVDGAGFMSLTFNRIYLLAVKPGDRRPRA